MATSSLFDHIRVNNPRAVEEFVEASANAELKPHTEDRFSGVVTDPERLRLFMSKALQRKRILK